MKIYENKIKTPAVVLFGNVLFSKVVEIPWIYKRESKKYQKFLETLRRGLPFWKGRNRPHVMISNWVYKVVCEDCLFFKKT